MPRCRRQPASRRIWSLHNKSIGAPLHCNRPYGYGLRCGVSMVTTPTPLVQSEQVQPQIFNYQRLRGRCACKHRNIRREISCGCDALPSVAAVFVLFWRKWRRVLNQGSAPLFSRSSSKSRMPECQSGDAGANPADRTIF
jgi:hypothetical protein